MTLLGVAVRNIKRSKLRTALTLAVVAIHSGRSRS